VKITIDQSSIDNIKTVLGDLSRRYGRELATAVNATAKKVRFEASKELKKELKVPVKILKKVIKQKARATEDKTQATIGFFKGYPIPLKYFGAKQLKKGGVSFKINPKFRITSVLKNAFIVKQYGGNVYERAGEKRFPLKKQFGPSPGSAFETLQLIPKMLVVAQAELPKQVQRRIRFLTLKANDGLRGKQKK
jgi:hypothetical protein